MISAQGEMRRPSAAGVRRVAYFADREVSLTIHMKKSNCPLQGHIMLYVQNSVQMCQRTEAT